MRVQSKMERVEGLKKCPFCGAVKVYVEVERYEIRKLGFPYTGKVQCVCGASMAVPEFFNTEDDAKSKAIDMWQQRD